MNLYRHSGAVTLSGLLGASLVGAGSAPALGFAYAWAIAWIPFVYINFLLTLGLGGIVGFLVGRAATAGKLRNTFVIGVLGLAWGVVAWYVAWAADARARGAEVAWLVWQPDQLWDYVGYFYENGLWGIGRGDNTVSGIPLGIVWLIEAGVVMGAATFMAMGASLSQTFCERCRCWIETQQGVRRLSLQDADSRLVERLLGGELSAAAELPRAGDGEPHLRLDLTCCPTCRESNYLSVERVTYETDDKGSVSEKSDTALDRLAITPRDIEAVRNAGREAAVPQAAGPQASSQTAPASERS